jgi:hypothetical protein
VFYLLALAGIVSLDLISQSAMITDRPIVYVLSLFRNRLKLERVHRLTAVSVFSRVVKTARSNSNITDSISLGLLRKVAPAANM